MKKLNTALFLLFLFSQIIYSQEIKLLQTIPESYFNYTEQESNSLNSFVKKDSLIYIGGRYAMAKWNLNKGYTYNHNPDYYKFSSGIKCNGNLIIDSELMVFNVRTKEKFTFIELPFSSDISYCINDSTIFFFEQETNFKIYDLRQKEYKPFHIQGFSEKDYYYMIDMYFIKNLLYLIYCEAKTNNTILISIEIKTGLIKNKIKLEKNINNILGEDKSGNLVLFYSLTGSLQFISPDFELIGETDIEALLNKSSILDNRELFYHDLSGETFSACMEKEELYFMILTKTDILILKLIENE